MYQRIIIISDYLYLEEALTASNQFPGVDFSTLKIFEHNYNDFFILDEIVTIFDHSNILKIGNHDSARLKKPFMLKDLITQIQQKMQLRVFYLGSIEFHPHVKLLKNSDVEIVLTNRESELLYFLVINSGKYLEGGLILNSVWGYSQDIETSTLDTHIYELRKNLEKLGIKDLIKCKNSKYYIDELI